MVETEREKGREHGISKLNSHEPGRRANDLTGIANCIIPTNEADLTRNKGEKSLPQNKTFVFVMKFSFHV